MIFTMLENFTWSIKTINLLLIKKNNECSKSKRYLYKNLNNFINKFKM